MGRWDLLLSWFTLLLKYQSTSSFSFLVAGTGERANEQRPSEEGMVHPQSSFDPHSGHVFLLWLNHLGVHTGHVTCEYTHHVHRISLIDSGRLFSGVISSYGPSFHLRTELTSRQTSPAQHYSSTSPTSSHPANKGGTSSQVSINH
jgi:hypothetical protein